MTKDELDQIEEIVKKHKPGGGDDGCLIIPIIVLLVLFLNGCFKGCGY